MPLYVRDTNLVNVRVGDILAYHAKGIIPEGDFLGALITAFEGSKGLDGLSGPYDDITHLAWVRRMPTPTAEVVEVKPSIFKVVDSQVTTYVEKTETAWADENPMRIRKHSHSGIKLEATWPSVQENVIDWENAWMRVFRIREFTAQMIEATMAFNDDMIDWQYDIADFCTFGNLRLPNAKICSELVADNAYYGSLAVTLKYGIALTPDIAGNKDTQKTPNDILNSGLVYPIKYQGLLKNVN
jgi:hypothetical protein